MNKTTTKAQNNIEDTAKKLLENKGLSLIFMSSNIDINNQKPENEREYTLNYANADGRNE